MECQLPTFQALGVPLGQSRLHRRKFSCYHYYHSACEHLQISHLLCENVCMQIALPLLHWPFWASVLTGAATEHCTRCARFAMSWGYSRVYWWSQRLPNLVTTLLLSNLLCTKGKSWSATDNTLFWHGGPHPVGIWCAPCKSVSTWRNSLVFCEDGVKIRVHKLSTSLAFEVGSMVLNAEA